MSFTSTEIKNLPPTDEVNDSDYFVIEKEMFTAKVEGAIAKDYFLTELKELIEANTYTADEITLTLSANEFSVKDEGITFEKLAPSVRLLLQGDNSQTLEGTVKTYIDPLTASGNFLEITVVPQEGAEPVKYALRLYQIPN
jgi:hypothetical protein